MVLSSAVGGRIIRRRVRLGSSCSGGRRARLHRAGGQHAHPGVLGAAETQRTTTVTGLVTAYPPLITARKVAVDRWFSVSVNAYDSPQ